MTNVGIKLSLDAGTLISSAAMAKQAIHDLDNEIKQAQKDGDPGRVGQLYYAKQQMETAATGFDRDTKSLMSNPQYQQIMSKQASGQPLSKSEEQYISRLDAFADAVKKNTDALYESIKNGKTEDITRQTAQIDEQARDFHKFAEQANTPTGARGMQEAVKAIGIEKITSAINAGFSQWVGSLDRTGIINQYGSGDIMGARISEERRQADLAGGMAQAGGGVAGSIVGSLIPGVGTILGGVLGTALGKGIDTFLKIKPTEDANEAAYAGLWQQRSGASMELAAVLGDPGKVREAFKTAADAAAEFGYSAEEGMDAMKQAAQQGLSGEEMKAVMNQSFDYERRTGADRGTLMGISTMSARYGAGDALSAGWAGLGASGMSPGQYNEYLRAMQRVMEDGISKGFVRSSKDVAESFAFLSQLTGNDSLWQGENGAKRLSEMNAGLEGATGLSSSSDIIAFRAARNLPGGDGSYINAMKILEQGLSGENGIDLFREYMNLTSGAEGGGKEGIVERMRQTFGLNYTNADALYKGWKENPNMDSESLKALIEENKGLPTSANSPELEGMKLTEAITNYWTQTGQKYWDEQLPKLSQSLADAMRGYNDKIGESTPKGRIEETLADLKDAASDPMELGSFEKVKQAQNDAISAQVEMGRVSGTVKRVTGGMFDEVFGSSEDKQAYNKVNSIFDSALTSGSASDRDTAMQFSELLGSVDRGALSQKNKNDDWNQLGNAGDIHGMVTLLREMVSAQRELIDATKETRVIDL